MVYVGCILIIIMSAYIGKYISNKYVYKDKFYQFLVGLCVYLKSNIGFNHTKIEQLFDDYIKSYKTEFNNEVNLFKKICFYAAKFFAAFLSYIFIDFIQKILLTFIFFVIYLCKV